MSFVNTLLKKISKKHPELHYAPPTIAGGALCLLDATDDASTTGSKKDNLQAFFHGVLQESIVSDPGPLFIVGMDEEELLQQYPNASRLMPVERISDVSMTPGSVMTTLRSLYGRTCLKDVVWDLVYLEQAGNELNKPGPLAMVPDWAASQLKLDAIASLLCSMHRNDATVGAALKALSQHQDFSFELLDTLTENAQKGALSKRQLRLFNNWKAQADHVVKQLGQMIDAPPLALRLLPSIRAGQNNSNPRVYYLHDDDLAEVAPLLDILILSHGLRQRHHWLIDTKGFKTDSSEGLNSLERLGSALWQARDARMSGYGAAMWVFMREPIPKVSMTKTYQHRLIQGVSQLVGREGDVLNAAVSALDLPAEEIVDHDDKEKLCGFRVADFAFRHFHEGEITSSIASLAGANTAA